MANRKKRVYLTDAAKEAGVHASEFTFDKITYRVENAQSRNVADVIATAWASADTNVTSSAE